MTLSNKTFKNLADALAPEVVAYIFEDERWVDFMQEIVPDAIRENLGEIDGDVLFDLSLCVMDRIVPKVA
jgi:hypothetical protein